MLHTAGISTDNQGKRAIMARTTCPQRMHMAQKAFPSKPVVPCTVDVGLGDKRALHRPSSTLRSRIGKRMVDGHHGLCRLGARGGRSYSCQACQTMQCDFIDKARRHITRQRRWLRLARQICIRQRVGGKVSVERTVCPCSSSPIWQPDANRVHIKITRYTKNPRHETAHHEGNKE